MRMRRGSITLQKTVEWAQRYFGEDGGLPALPEALPSLPSWLVDGIGEAVPIEETDSPLLEGGEGDAGRGPDPRPRSAVEDFFAFYLPFHFYSDGWGMYIRALGIDRLARIVAAPGPVADSSLLFAFQLLLEHEHLHFLVELAASRLEVATGAPCYPPYFANGDAAEHEEAVANAQALTAAKRGFSGLLSKAGASWMSQQGPGYRDFSKWLGRRLALGKRGAAEFMVPSPPFPHREGTWSASLPARPLEYLFEERRKSHPPSYLVLDVPVPWLRVARPFPKDHGLQVFVHTNDHKPPHIHVDVLQRRIESRYEWPALRPLSGDQRLSRAEEKRLCAYVATYEDVIDSKVKSVPWQ